VLLSVNVSASEGTLTAELKLKPNICILPEAESQCKTTIVAEWKAKNNKAFSVCLIRKSDEKSIACWQDAAFGRIEFNDDIAQSTQFELRDANNQLLGSDMFQVINEQKKYLRSRRNPWSFF